MRLETERLILRPWEDDDLDSIAALNADPVVMEHMPRLRTRDQSENMMALLNAEFEAEGFGFGAVELQTTGECIGFVGLHRPNFEAHFMPAVEIGWRLARAHWGHGYASEAANAWLKHGFETAKLAEIVSFTVAANVRSIAVMERIGMTRDPDCDFDHPMFEPGHRLRRHVFYRKRRGD